MKNPKQIEVIKEGASYILPTYEVTNNGIVEGLGCTIQFCKGSTSDKNIFRQEGLFTETLLFTCLTQLESVNIGELKSEYTTEAIKNIKIALMWLHSRTQDRIDRQVKTTYQK